MHFWIGVENFAKIERARVCIDNYTLFVGPNNSGKSFLMQLIQGMSNIITDCLDEGAMEIVLEEKKDGYSKYLIKKENVAQFIAHINKGINLKKEQIIKEIFGREIPVGKLYIDMELEENISYQIDIVDNRGTENEEVRKSIDKKKIFIPTILRNDKETKWKTANLSMINIENETLKLVAGVISIEGSDLSVFRSALGGIFGSSSLFLPSSRTGLMLLYREFFVNKTDSAISYRVGENELIENKERYGGLTQPVYEFLRFLQTYSEYEESSFILRNELAFFEERIIEGHISAKKQGDFSYQAKDDDRTVPMYLASAMVNEVAPLILALTSRRKCDRLIIDEVEASLHPQKQMELARFLNRINNKGIKLILSTHSDTFVSKLNNLYVLSEQIRLEQREDVKEHFQIEMEDLILSEDLFVYEFVLQANGKSIVEEIIPDPKTGFKFELFTKSAMDLYYEALKLGEMHLND